MSVHLAAKRNPAAKRNLAAKRLYLYVIGVGTVAVQGFKFQRAVSSGMTLPQALFKTFGTDKIAIGKSSKYKPSQTRPARQPWVHPKGFDHSSNSHWVAEGWARGVLNKPRGQKIVTRLGTTTEQLVDKLKLPLNIKVVWKEMHLRTDSGASGLCDSKAAGCSTADFAASKLHP
jgi:hypothetical protein